LSEKSGERDYLEEGIDGSKVLYRIFKKCKVFQVLIDLTQATDEWWALLNSVMNIVFHKMGGIFRLSKEPFGIQ
jgi:hypothetical protein